MKQTIYFLFIVMGILIAAQSFALAPVSTQLVSTPMMATTSEEASINMQWDGGCSQPAHPDWFIFPQPHQPVPVNSWVNWNQWQVIVNFQNTYPFPVICQGTLYGQTYHGRTGYLNFQLGPIYSGVTAYAYMNTVYGDPVVNGWANSICYQY